MNKLMTKKPLMIAIVAVLVITILILGSRNQTNDTRQSSTPSSAKETIPEPLKVMPLAWLEFVRVAPGEFLMGCDVSIDKCQEDELPQHKVTISQNFSISKFEITQKAWQEIMQSNPSTFIGEHRPVETVSYDDVQEFIKKLNQIAEEPIFRLPTESEWEYLARAGQNSIYPQTNEQQPIEQIAWFGKKETQGTQEVGKLAPNLWGIHDLAGNVMEWVEDCWHENYQQAPLDASARISDTCESRVLRGGSWIDSQNYIRTAYRNNWDNNYRSHEIGLRLVRMQPKGKFSNYPPKQQDPKPLQQQNVHSDEANKSNIDSKGTE